MGDNHLMSQFGKLKGAGGEIPFAPSPNERTSVAARAKETQQRPPVAWQPITILVLLALLVVLLLTLTLCSGSHDDVDHVALGDYIHAVEPEGAILESREVTGGPGAEVHDVDGTATRASMRILDEGRATTGELGKTSIAAFGDVVIGNTLLGLAEGWDGTSGDGAYSFSPLFSNVSGIISSYDISAGGEIGCLGGFEGKGYAGWPQYNTPDELASSMALAGFRVVNVNTGHLLDWGLESATRAQGVWQEQSSLLAVGSYANQVDEDLVRVVECNGVRVAFLSYSTQQSVVAVDASVPDCVAPLATEESIREGVANALTVADAVVVFMHWGDEATHTVNDQQRSLAAACANAGATAVIGCGSRELQALEWLVGADGKRCLVAYGLGALASCYSTSDEILSAALTFDVALLDNGGAEISNVVVHPLIEHRADEVSDTVYMLRNYSDELASANMLLMNEFGSLERLKTIVSDVFGTGVNIDM